MKYRWKEANLETTSGSLTAAQNSTRWKNVGPSGSCQAIFTYSQMAVTHKTHTKICYHGNGVAMTTNQSIMTERIKRMSATWPVRERPKGKIDRIEPLMWQTFKLVHTRTTPCCRVATHWGEKWSRLSLNKVMHHYKVYFWLWTQMTGKNKHIFMEMCQVVFSLVEWVLSHLILKMHNTFNKE